MALRTLQRRVRARERKLGLRVVIKRYAQPGGGVVADRAFLREARGTVVWIVGPVEVLQVAAHTIGTRGAEVVVGMACRALQLGVRARQGKTRELGVIKRRSQPAIHPMAELALCGEADRGVVGIARPGKVRGMATAACRRKPHKLPVGGALVA